MPANKKTSSKTAKTKTTPSSGTQGTAAQPARIKVRMYRQGLGDCFLITVPRENERPFFTMIDCGVILGTQDAAAKMQKVVQHIIDSTNGHIDLLAVTHEHWDHLSGFLQAQELFTSKLTFGQIWVAWTEDPKDELANSLRSRHQKMRAALAAACARMGVSGNPGAAQEVFSMLDFFGAAGSGTTTDALKIVKGLSATLRFCRPSDPPTLLEGTHARVYVLGPPHDEKKIMQYNPSTSHPETYGLAGDVFLNAAATALAESPDSTPFGNSFQIPSHVAGQMDFFRQYYWGEAADAAEMDQSWRRIDGAWLDSSSSLALQLDSATNNTSLALAIELKGGDVLLFAADAQVGNWLSWQDLSWDVAGQKVTGPDLLRRVKVYKAGHHGSHNATLREKGLEIMTGLQIVLIPVDHAMALKKRWGNMPLPDLVARMSTITQGRVLRIDEQVPDSLKGHVAENDLYYEVSI